MSDFNVHTQVYSTVGLRQWQNNAFLLVMAKESKEYYDDDMMMPRTSSTGNCLDLNG